MQPINSSLIFPTERLHQAEAFYLKYIWNPCSNNIVDVGLFIYIYIYTPAQYLSSLYPVNNFSGAAVG